MGDFNEECNTSVFVIYCTSVPYAQGLTPLPYSTSTSFFPLLCQPLMLLFQEVDTHFLSNGPTAYPTANIVVIGLKVLQQEKNYFRLEFISVGMSPAALRQDMETSCQLVTLPS